LRVLTEGLDIPVRGIERDGAMVEPGPEVLLRPEDHLLLSGSLEDILRVKDLRSVGLRSDLQLPAARGGPQRLLEVSIPPTSGLAERSLRELRFTERYGVTVLAIHRHPSLQGLNAHLDLLGALAGRDTLEDVPLATGDLLLLSGSEERLQALSRDADLTVLGGVEYQRPRYRRAALAVAIFAGTIFVAGARLISPAIAGLAGLVLMVATGCTDSRTAKSGAGEFLARGILPLSHVAGPRGVLAGLMLLTVLLSIPMSNQAAALILLPVGVHAALDMGLAPRTFAIGTCLAASCSFLTPLEPSAALVYGPGRYRFADFLRIGSPLTVLVLVMLLVLVPILWPFTGR
jgi:di/tricarboxylate transporter